MACALCTFEPPIALYVDSLQVINVTQTSSYQNAKYKIEI